MQSESELWDVYTRDRQQTGRTHRRGLPLAAGDYHLVVLVWIRDSAGRYVITRRHPDKPWPGFWECTGGSVLAGEDSRSAAVREVAEETGLILEAAAGHTVDNFHGDDSLYDVWLFQAEPDLATARLQDGEVTDIRWATEAEITGLLDQGTMAPGLRRAFESARGFGAGRDRQPA